MDFDWKNHAFPMWSQYIPLNGNLMEEKYPKVREKIGTNYLGSPNSIDFTAFSHPMGNRRGNPNISRIIKYTIEYESNDKKHPYHGKSMSTN